MNWDAIGSVGTMVGSVAVVVTLIYLSRQWRESNLLAKSTMAHTLATSFATINELVIANPQAAELLVRLKEPGAELSEVETIQAQMLAFRFFNNFVQGQAAFDHGHVYRENLQGLKDSLRYLVETYPAFEPYILQALKAHPSMSGFEVFDFFKGRL